jgi:hypothetical protein
MQQWYQCPRCGKSILYGANPCPYCKCSLAWSQQGPMLYIPPPGAPQQPPPQYQQPQQTPQYQQPYQQPQQPGQYYQQQPEPPKKKSNKLGIIVLAVVLVALAAVGSCVVCVMVPGSSETSVSTPQTTPTQVDDSIKPGMYKVGMDIQAGEYVLFANSGLPAYFQVSSDSSGTLDSIITNDNFNGNRYITVVNGQYIEFTKAKMFPVNKAPVLQPVDGKYLEGMYKVGRDIIAGEYKVVSDGGTSYLEVASDSSGALESIVTNDNFTGEKYITIQDGQYIKLSRCHIVE